MQEKTIAKTRLVSDPLVLDHNCLPAYRTAGSGLSRPAVTFLLAVRLLVALLLAAVAGLTGFYAVHLGYDWGYWSIASFLEQPTGWMQSVGAIYSLNLFIVPMFFGFTFGCLKAAWSGSRGWTIATFLINLAWLSCNSQINNYLLFDGNPVAIPFAAASFVFNLTGMWFGQKLYSALRFRVRLHKILACTAFGIGLLGLFGSTLADSPSSWPGNSISYAATLIATGALAAFCGRARDKVAGVIVSMLAIVPILMANFLNVAGNIICLILDTLGHGPHLGWQALLSATLISALTLASTALGGLLGFWFRDKSLNRALR